MRVLGWTASAHSVESGRSLREEAAPDYCEDGLAVFRAQTRELKVEQGLTMEKQNNLRSSCDPVSLKQSDVGGVSKPNLTM